MIGLKLFAAFCQMLTPCKMMLMARFTVYYCELRERFPAMGNSSNSVMLIL